MNKKGQIWAVYLMIAAIIVVVLFSLIPAWIAGLDLARGSNGLNCPGTPDFNQTVYNNENATDIQIRRPPCFVTGISMIYFTGAVLIVTAIWLYKKVTGK